MCAPLVSVTRQAKEGGLVSGAGGQLQAFFALRNNYVFVYALMMGAHAVIGTGFGVWGPSVCEACRHA